LNRTPLFSCVTYLAPKENFTGAVPLPQFSQTMQSKNASLQALGQKVQNNLGSILHEQQEFEVHEFVL